MGDISGTVTRIRIRATTVTDWDRKELIIPNKEFVTTRINNWSLSDPILRIILPVGVAYGSDTQKATQLLLDVARACQHVLDDPPPRALFLGFGDSSLNLELRVFIPSIDSFLTTRHELHEAIDKAFREAGIEIAFPQRDIHVRSVRSEPTRSSRDAPGGAAPSGTSAGSGPCGAPGRCS
ncbi:MAG: mechanosensitive ion channel family protein [Planctomycetota bacterium]